MAIDINTKYPGRVNAPDANYITGSIKNETVPESSNDGTPLDEDWGNDIEGAKQALLLAGGLTASGNPETAIASQILQSVVQQSMGRAFSFDDSGAVNAYTADLRSSQQAPGAVFNGQKINITPGNTNTSASTLDVSALLDQAPATTIIDIKLQGGVSDPAAGDITAGVEARLIYRTSPGIHAELETQSSSGIVKQIKRAVKTDTFSTASSSFVDVAGLSVSITPTSASSKINLRASVNGDTSSANRGMFVQIFQDGSVIYEGDAAGSRTRTAGIILRSTASEETHMHNVTVEFEASPGDTSAHTYQVYVKMAAGTGYINKTATDADTADFPRGVSSIEAWEVSE